LVLGLEFWLGLVLALALIEIMRVQVN